VLVTDMSAGVRIESVSVALSFAEFGSTTPAGVATDAVLATVPVAPPLSVPVATKVTEPPEGRSTRRLRLPLPLAAPQLPPPAPEQVQVTPVIAAGKGSVPVAPPTAFRPPVPPP